MDFAPLPSVICQNIYNFVLCQKTGHFWKSLISHWQRVNQTNLPREGDLSPSSIFSYFGPLSRRLIGDLLLPLRLDPLLLPLLPLLDEDFELLLDPLPQQNVQ